jgi:hypothetical protein
MNELDKLALRTIFYFSFTVLFLFLLLVKSSDYYFENNKDILPLLLIMMNTFFMGYFATRFFKSYRMYIMTKRYGREFTWNDKNG